MSEEVIYLWNGGRKTGRRVRNASGRLSRFIGHSKVTCPKCGGHGVNVRSGLPCIRCMGDGTVPAPGRRVRRRNPEMTQISYRPSALTSPGWVERKYYLDADTAIDEWERDMKREGHSRSAEIVSVRSVTDSEFDKMHTSHKRHRRKKNPTGITFSGAYFRPVRKRGASRRPRFTRIWRGRSRAVFARHVPRGWGAVAKRLTNGRRRSRSRK